MAFHFTQSKSQRTYKGLWNLTRFGDPVDLLPFSCLPYSRCSAILLFIGHARYGPDSGTFVLPALLPRILFLRDLCSQITFSVRFSLIILPKIAVSLAHTNSNTPYLTSLLYFFSIALIALTYHTIYFFYYLTFSTLLNISHIWKRFFSLFFSSTSPEPRTVPACHIVSAQ